MNGYKFYSFCSHLSLLLAAYMLKRGVHDRNDEDQQSVMETVHLSEHFTLRNLMMKMSLIPKDVWKQESSYTPTIPS